MDSSLCRYEEIPTVSQICLFTAVSQVPCFWHCHTDWPSFIMGGFFFFLSAAVAMATHRVDDDGLKVYSVLPPINPPPKTCSVTLITEIYTENVLQSLFIKTQNRREMTVCVCAAGGR